MQQKSPGLNQKTPLYSTRTHPDCIEFKIRTQQKEQREIYLRNTVHKRTMSYIDFKINTLSIHYHNRIDKFTNTIISFFTPNFYKDATYKKLNVNG